MVEKVVPMIHVPDVQATVDWYRDIGFTVIDTYGHDGEGLSFAILSFGNSQVMFNQGGRPSTQTHTFVLGLVLLPCGLRLPLPRKSWYTRAYAKCQGLT